MNQPLTENEIKEFAAQLRKPDGETGIKEPPQENWGKLYDRGSLIVCAGKK